MAARPCLECSTPTTRTPARCDRCEAQHQAARNARRTHYQGQYTQQAKRVRDAANIDLSTRCWRCGGLARPGDPWQAGHIHDSQPGSPLAPEHRSCNAAAGGRTAHP